MKHRFLILALILTLFLNGCSLKNDEYELKVANLQDQISSYQENEIKLNKINKAMSSSIEEIEQEKLLITNDLKQTSSENEILETKIVELSKELLDFQSIIEDYERYKMIKNGIDNIDRFKYLYDSSDYNSDLSSFSYVYDIDKISIGDTLAEFHISEIKPAFGDGPQYVKFEGQIVLQGIVEYDLRTDDELRMYLSTSEVFSNLPLETKNVEYVMEKGNSYSIEGISDDDLSPFTIQDVVESEDRIFYIVAVFDEITDVHHQYEGALSYVNLVDVLYFDDILESHE